MIKNVIFAVLQFLLFFIAFGIGSCSVHPRLQQTLSVPADGTRVFVWDGVVVMLLLFLVILAIEAARKRFRSSAPWTAIALALAAAAGFALKFGLLTVEKVTVFR